MRSILFIINPISGTGKKKIIEKRAPHILKHAFDIHFAYTQGPGDATNISANAIGKYDIVVAVGGDGTINEVSKAIVGTNTVLAIIPCGSGNGFARFLKIPLSIDKALKYILNAEVHTIDCGIIDNKHFINIAGIGFDAEIGHIFDSYGKRGPFSYIKIILKEYFKYKAKHYKLIIDNNPIETNALLLSIANSSQWGLNAHIAPLAKIDDGLLEISILKNIPFFSIIPVAIKLFNKTLHTSKYLNTFNAKRVEIQNNTELAGHVDGEPVIFGKKTICEIKQGVLKVLIP